MKLITIVLCFDALAAHGVPQQDLDVSGECYMFKIIYFSKFIKKRKMFVSSNFEMKTMK